jgi:protein-S-isoprenylcysteine O-methyltransferase Ste14
MNDNAKPSLILRIPTPIWLIGLVVITLVIDRLLPIPVLFQFKPAGYAILAFGIAVAAWGRLTFRARGAEILPWSEAHSTLVAAGPFRFTRNPMYFGLVTCGIGAALLEGTWLMWLVPIIVFVLDNFVIIPYEEASMERAYGDSYRAYKARVRRWL